MLLLETGIVMAYTYFLFCISSFFLFLRFLITYFAGNIMLGGFFGLKKTSPGGLLLLVFMIAGEILCNVLARQRKLRGYEAWVTIRFQDRIFRMKGYLDTGNFLRDDLTGEPVIIAGYGSFRKYLGEKQKYILDLFYKEGCMDAGEMLRLGIRTMECASIGTEGRLLPVLTADEISYVINKKEVQKKRQSILLSDTPLFGSWEYDILLNKDL